MTEDDGRRDYYQQWYDKNRDARNDRRRARYEKDADLRARERERVRKYRAQQQDPAEVGRMFRELDGTRHEVFRVGDVAEDIGAHASVIRRYEKQGAIPLPSFPGEHRLYTKHQVSLIAEICNFKRNTRYSWRRPQKQEQEQALIDKIKDLWEQGL
jgi:hypothetical protein